MSLPIQGITPPIGSFNDAPSETAIRGAPEADFGATLGKVLGDAGRAEKTADDMATRFAAGDPGIGIHEVMIAAEKAQIAVKFAVTLKNKVIEAYRELMNTQI